MASHGTDAVTGPVLSSRRRRPERRGSTYEARFRQRKHCGTRFEGQDVSKNHDLLAGLEGRY